MAEAYIAEIRIFPYAVAGNQAPRGWAACNGQLMPISQNTALFSILGTFYGGNGTSHFGLPNLQSRVPLSWGTGPGLSQYIIGELGGAETVTLSNQQLASHFHLLQAAAVAGVTAVPGGGTLAEGQYTSQGQSGGVQYYSTKPPNVAMASNAIAPTGGGAPHNNLMPYLVLNFCIALQGVFPPRSPVSLAHAPVHPATPGKA